MRFFFIEDVPKACYMNTGHDMVGHAGRVVVELLGDDAKVFGHEIDN